ncbi:MAG: hypothetical protein K8F91_03020 [Candidatus Obscuribacterales bacterium]|nr:hypothetical protein [Candidatus Obscuribacterales bacterium]
MTCQTIADFHITSHGEFSSSHWLAYFRANQATRPIPVRIEKIAIEKSIREPVLRSLKRFQIGESGDGKRLLTYAARLQDKDYLACAEMFIKEEQSHAQALAEVILALDDTLLSWHWSDLCFVFLRHLSGLKTELLILFIAEIIGKCFYKMLAEKIENEALSETFSLILLDELLHLEFHSQFLKTRFAGYPLVARQFLRFCLWLLFKVACFAFSLDHKGTLVALGTTGAAFSLTAESTFQLQAKRIFNL